MQIILEKHAYTFTLTCPCFSHQHFWNLAQGWARWWVGVKQSVNTEQEEFVWSLNKLIQRHLFWHIERRIIDLLCLRVWLSLYRLLSGLFKINTLSQNTFWLCLMIIYVIFNHNLRVCVYLFCCSEFKWCKNTQI